MITKDQIMPLLLEACPSFTEKWTEYCASYGNEDLLYVELSTFANHIVEIFKANRIDEFPAVFEIIERLHLEGDDYVREAATIGALEGIQNAGENSRIDTEEFIQYLRPESLKWWRQLNEFWTGKIPFVGDFISET